MTHTLLLTWHMTGDEKYLEPIRSDGEDSARLPECTAPGQPGPRHASLVRLAARRRGGGRRQVQAPDRQRRPRRPAGPRTIAVHALSPGGRPRTARQGVEGERRFALHQLPRLYQRGPIYGPRPSIPHALQQGRNPGQSRPGGPHPHSGPAVFQRHRRSRHGRVLSYERRAVADASARHRRVGPRRQRQSPGGTVPLRRQGPADGCGILPAPARYLCADPHHRGIHRGCAGAPGDICRHRPAHPA